MLRFVIQSNIERHSQLLAAEANPAVVETLRQQLTGWRRELALLDSTDHGVAVEPLPPALRLERGWGGFQQLYERSATPTLLLHPGAGLHIVDLNDAYANATGISWSRSGGERMFDVFPDNPEDPDADGVANLYRSLRAVSETHKAHAMAVQRYDVRVDGVFLERHWLPFNTPVFDQHGRLSYIVHQVQRCDLHRARA
jgi:hypothetical protein